MNIHRHVKDSGQTTCLHWFKTTSNIIWRSLMVEWYPCAPEYLTKTIKKRSCTCNHLLLILFFWSSVKLCMFSMEEAFTSSADFIPTVTDCLDVTLLSECQFTWKNCLHGCFGYWHETRTSSFARTISTQMRIDVVAKNLYWRISSMHLLGPSSM